MSELREKIKSIIERERKSEKFSVLDLDKGVDLIQQLISNYEVINGIERQTVDSTKDKKKAELILVMAPTGAGKDTLVAKLNYQNPEKKYIELNMDIFRHYFPIFIKDTKRIKDKNFALLTNEFSYEIYTTIQEILLTEYPGTNIIITGTLRQTDWIEYVIKKFKSDPKTDYTVRLLGLVVSKKESAISTIQRYLGIVDTQSNDDLRASRYTSLTYHDETYEKYPDNFSYFENMYSKQSVRLIDSIEVYTRSKNINDLSENTRVYSSEDDNENKTALDVIMELREEEYKISFSEFDDITKKIIKNKKYLKEQGVLTEIIRNLAIILDYPKILDKLDKIKEKINSDLPNIH